MTDARRFERALITGIAGSGGSYPAEYIVRHRPDAQVHGLTRWHSTTDRRNLRDIEGDITIHEADLMDLGSVMSALGEARPDVIFHLAAHANVRASFTTPHAVVSNNVLGTVNLFEAIRQSGLDPVVQLCSTSEVYGQVQPDEVPIGEDCPMRPASPYAVSKAAQDLMGGAYWASYRQRIIRTRMFTYLNPRRADLFATSFARQVAWIEAGLQENEITHGNLDSVRTLLDVRDAMRAYWLAAEHCAPGEVYNIGGSATVTVGEFLDRLIALSRVKVLQKLDPSLLRPADVTLQVPRVDKFRQATGWQPEIPIEQSITDLLDHWRTEARAEQQRRQLAH